MELEWNLVFRRGRKYWPLYQDVVQHPFNEQLADGSLPGNKFDFYQQQDAIYLKSFSRALFILASKLDDASDVKIIFRLAADCLVAERKETVVLNEPALFAMLYTGFLLNAAAYESKKELAAALLVCFWIYLELATELRKKVNIRNKYRAWVDLYSSKKYHEMVYEMIGVVDRLALKSSPGVHVQMFHQFEWATRLELHFWDGTFNLQNWKIHH